MIGVIDTSALIRLFIPDGPIPRGLEKFMNGVEKDQDVAIAPDLLMVESANVLNKKRKSGELSENESRKMLADVIAMPIRLFPDQSLIPRSFDLAIEYRLTVYDALYIALAIEQSAVIFSADEHILKIADVLNLGI